MGQEPRSPITISSSDSKVLTRAGYGTIYFLGFEGDAIPAPLKVGCARNVQDRLSSHQTSNWRTIVVQEILFIKCRASLVLERRVRDARRHDDAEDIHAALLDEMCAEDMPVEVVEDAIHADLDRQGLRVRGEWFSGGAELLVGSAKRVLREMGMEFDTSRTMMRRLKMWKIESQEAEAASVFGTSRYSSVRAIADRNYSRAKQYGATKARY